MLETYLKVDALFRLTTPQVAEARHGDGDFVEHALVPMSVEKAGFFSKTGGLREGASANVKKNFQWLAYFEGAITHVPLASNDVLTGPMSGCWVVVYKVGLVEHVGHVGTVHNNAARTAVVKQAWKQHATNHPDCVVAGFNPFDAVDTTNTKSKGDDGTLRCYGLVTATKELYAVSAWIQEYEVVPKQLVGTQDKIIRIAQVTRVLTADLATLQNLGPAPAAAPPAPVAAPPAPVAAPPPR